MSDEQFHEGPAFGLLDEKLGRLYGIRGLDFVVANYICRSKSSFQITHKL